jgi:endonuclease/exonuclease/phosphatase family metal-dependent hydrolase
MARRQFRLVLLMALAGCGTSLGPAGAWMAWEDIEGPLRPEVVPPPEPAVPGERIRVATFNVELGPDPEALARAIAADPDLARVDLLLVQEIEAYPGEPASRADRLAAALGMGHVYAPAREEGDGTHGLAILTRFALSDIEVMELPHADLGSRSRRRIALAASIAAPAGTLRLVDVHLDTRINITDRIEQLDPAIPVAADRLIVAGDFNTNPYVWVEGTAPIPPADAVADTDQAPLLDDFMTAIDFATPTGELGATWHAGPFTARLDSIYLRGLTAGAGEVATDVDGSDHWPLWLDVD